MTAQDGQIDQVQTMQHGGGTHVRQLMKRLLWVVALALQVPTFATAGPGERSANKVDLIEREDAPAARLQIFIPLGFFLQPGIKLTVDKGISMRVPYTICLANGCVAATVADPGFVRALNSGRMLSIEGVNTDVVTVITSLPLDNFAKTHQGAAAQVFEQRLEGKWEQPADEGSAK